MENRRQKIYSWYLTRKGRWIGILLYVITAALFMAALGVVAYLVNQFGADILTEPDKSYYRTEYYENALRDDIKTLLQNAKKVYWDSSADKFSIECVNSYGLAHDYDMQLIREAYEKEEIPETLDELNIYEKYAGTDNRLMPGMFCYYNKAYAYIRSLRNKNAYIYITGDTMRELMIQRGYVNTDYQISNKIFRGCSFSVYRYRTAGGRAEEFYEVFIGRIILQLFYDCRGRRKRNSRYVFYQPVSGS